MIFCCLLFGILFGYVTTFIYFKTLPSGTTSKYLSHLGKNVAGLFKGALDRFWEYYWGIIRCSFLFAGRQLISVLLAMLPLVVFVAILWPFYRHFAQSYRHDLEFIFFLSFLFSSGIAVIHYCKKRSASTGAGFRLGSIDYLLVWLATTADSAMRRLGDIETRCMCRRLSAIVLDKPIYITGLARAGTTIILEGLNRLEGMASHRNRDFPFVMTPVLWNNFLSLFSTRQDPIERAHKDGIMITRESPDAFEEPIWQHFFPHVHDPDKDHRLQEHIVHKDFERFYVNHIKKIILIRKGRRYLAKGNYNIARLEYIAKILPDARFCIVIRHPFQHIASLLREHNLFMSYYQSDPRISDYLKSVGHYEFGPQRQPLCLYPEMGRSIKSAWEQGLDHVGYAIQWREIYGYVAQLRRDRADLAERIHVIRYEDFCLNTEEEMKKLAHHCALELPAKSYEDIRMSTQPLGLKEDQLKNIWSMVKDVALLYGYHNEVST